MKKERPKFNHVLVMRQKYILPKEPDELDLLLETFKLRTHDIPDDSINSLFGEKKKMDRLIVMEDVLGVADISKKLQIL